MLAFRAIPDEHAALGCSPILRGASLILGYAAEHRGIELTQTKAFKRSFVAWALSEFDWPRERQDQPYALGRALNEHDFPPLQMLHYLLISARLARHSKGRFLITRKGTDLLGKPGALFDAIVPMFVLKIDHAGCSRFGEGVAGNWDIWLNVMNQILDLEPTEERVFSAFYGPIDAGSRDRWRELFNFRQSVLEPLEWAGLVQFRPVANSSRAQRVCRKTALWGEALVLDAIDTGWGGVAIPADALSKGQGL
ncbi:hypothetical protein ACFOHK_16970 [Falsigemmobacter intermedius]|uniref:hypothetical protein n=2 Tax=Falsigemmobacter intermedius TaxID=1553448 RepID=UPI0035F06022